MDALLHFKQNVALPVQVKQLLSQLRQSELVELAYLPSTQVS